MMQEYTQEMKNLILDMIRDIHTVIPGIIQSFNSSTNEADILPFGKYKKPNGELIDYPKCANVPVCFMQSAGQSATIAYPIKAGDECLLFFSEQALDTWKTGAESNIDLRFDLTNAIALVGMFAKANPVIKEACDKDAVIINRGKSQITLLPDGKVDIVGDVTIHGVLTVNGAGRIDNVDIGTHSHMVTDVGSPTGKPI